MGTLKTQPWNGLAALGLRDEDARLARVLAFDGLQATQAVREWTREGHGLPEQLLATLPARLEWQPDASAAVPEASPVSDATGLQGQGRYLANPSVEGKQLAGLWVGGPVEMFRDGQTGKLTCRQTITRVRSAGLVWSVDGTTGLAKLEAYEAPEPEDGEEEAPNPNDPVDMLKACRPAIAKRNERRAIFRDDMPARRVLEATFKHWTHESGPFFDALTGADMEAVLAHHGVSADEWKPASWGLDIEAETNAGVLRVRCEAKTAHAPANAYDLAALPYRIVPATRETLRAFGLESEAKGEGYAYAKLVRWEDIARSARAAIEYPNDLQVLAHVLDAFPLPDEDDPPGTTYGYPAWPNVDQTTALTTSGGRVWKRLAGTGQTFATEYDAGNLRPWWRVLRWAVEEQEDGLLALTMLAERPEWTNRGQSPDTAAEALGAPVGLGKTLQERVPGVPRADAEALLATAATKTGYLMASRTAREGERGAADVATDWIRVWSYAGQDKPGGLPTVSGIEAPEIEERHATSQEGAGLTCRFYRVNPANVATLLAAAKLLVCPNGQGYELRSSGARANEAGDITVWASSTKYRFSLSVTWFDEYEETEVHYATQFRRKKYNVGDSGAGDAEKQSDCPEVDEMRIHKITTHVKAVNSRTAAFAWLRSASAQNPRLESRGGQRFIAKYDVVVSTPWFEDPGQIDDVATTFAANYTAPG